MKAESLCDRAVQARCRRHRGWLFPVALLAGLDTAHAASAGSTGATEAAEELGEIVVTARRREESLQDTPVAVTVLTGDMLERMQVLGTTDLDKVAPNLQFHSYGTLTGNNSAAQVFIRGIGQTDATPAVDPGVGPVHRRCLHGPFRGRRDGNARHRQHPGAARTAGNAVRSQHHRRCGAAHHQWSGRRRRQHVAGRHRRGQPDRRCSVPSSPARRREMVRAHCSGGDRKRDGYVTRVYRRQGPGRREHRYNGQLAVRWLQPQRFTGFRHCGATTRTGKRERFALRVPVDERGRPVRRRRQHQCGLPEHPRWTATAHAGRVRSPIRAAATMPRRRAPSPTAARRRPSARCDNSGGRWSRTWDATEAAFLQVDHRGPHPEVVWRPRCRQHAAAGAAHQLPQPRASQFSQELQALYDSERLDGVVGLYYFDEDSTDRVLVVPFPIPALPTTRSAWTWARQRQGGLHGVDVQAHRPPQRHCRHALHRRNQVAAGHAVQRRAGHQGGAGRTRPRCAPSMARRPRRPVACS